jgi:hypothetical protein
MIRLFKSNKPKEGNIYAVQTGDYAGELLLFIEKSAENYHFLSIPPMTNRTVPIDKFDFALKEGILEFVERTPTYVRKTSKFKFYENKSQLRSAT